jgi:hypothetical protein
MIRGKAALRARHVDAGDRPAGDGRRHEGDERHEQGGRVEQGAIDAAARQGDEAERDGDEGSDERVARGRVVVVAHRREPADGCRGHRHRDEDDDDRPGHADAQVAVGALERRRGCGGRHGVHDSGL